MGAETVTFPVVVHDVALLRALFTMTPYRWHAPTDISARLDGAAAAGFETQADVVMTTYVAGDSSPHARTLVSWPKPAAAVLRGRTGSSPSQRRHRRAARPAAGVHLAPARPPRALRGGVGAGRHGEHRLGRRLPGPPPPSGLDLGKVLDPIADRLLLIAGVGAILIDGSVPAWVAAVALGREVIVRRPPS